MLMHMALWAQMPRLIVPQAERLAVRLERLQTEVSIYGNIASTQMTMVFKNPSSRMLEAELQFPLPEGATLSAYALDIQGKLRPAVAVEKARATEVFEEIQRQNIDPGLVERLQGNVFRTRIYPLPAGGTRTIQVRYEQVLPYDAQKLKYHLPLSFSESIPDFQLKVTVSNTLQKPELVENPEGMLVFQENNKAYSASIVKHNFKTTRGLTVEIPKQTSLPDVQLQKAEGGFYFMLNTYPKSISQKQALPNELGLIWDNSLSALDKDIAKELAFLDALIQTKKNLNIHLAYINQGFSKAGKYAIKNGDWAALRKVLTESVYDGGTKLSAIQWKQLPVEAFLLFSDGISTLSDELVAAPKPVYSVTSHLKSDYSLLKYLSEKSGGRFINLNTVQANEAARKLTEKPLRFLGIKRGAGLREVYPSMPTDIQGSFTLTGILDELQSKIVLLYGIDNKVLEEQEVTLNALQYNFNTPLVQRVWAQMKLNELDVFYDKNKEEITDLAKQFALVSRNTSLLVLENVTDYVRYGIEPPREIRNEYERLMAQKQLRISSEKKNRLESAIAIMKGLKDWHATDFKIKKDKYPKPIDIDSTVYFGEEAMLNEVQVSSPVAGTARRQARALSDNGVALSAGNKPAQETAKAAQIQLKNYKSDAAYMQQFESSDLNLAYQNYLRLRNTYKETPQFYFDIANWFFAKKAPTKAKLILSNIAELDLENAALYKLMAYKLKEAAAYEEALFLFKKVLEWRPMDAQSYRDYALALQDMGKAQQALDFLYQSISRSYSEEINRRDQGIEEVILMEMNQLISKHRAKINIKNIDPRLIAELPVDIRVVINWNKDHTDIDLWVTDPNGVKCSYQRKSTPSGGRISADITRGYGPEQFLLKKATAGKYKIEVNYYGDNQFKFSGPTTVMAEVYLYYASGKQERKLLVVPLSKEQGAERLRLIGDFMF